MTVAQLNLLPRPEKRYRMLQLENDFESGFFAYSRTGAWTQEVVGDNEAWIQVQGMKQWHVRSALRSLQYAADLASIPKIEVEPFGDAAEGSVDG